MVASSHISGPGSIYRSRDLVRLHGALGVVGVALTFGVLRG
jgi:hypothetical protein